MKDHLQRQKPEARPKFSEEEGGATEEEAVVEARPFRGWGNSMVWRTHVMEGSASWVVERERMRHWIRALIRTLDWWVGLRVSGLGD